MKEAKIYLAIALVVILIALAVFLSLIYKDYSEYSNYIKSGNEFSYVYWDCVSKCEVKVIFNTGAVRFDQECLDKCGQDSRARFPEEEFRVISEKDYGKVLIQDPAFLQCKNVYDSEGNADRFRSCLLGVMPSLREKYGIKI